MNRCGVKERVAFWGMEVGNMREMRGIFYLIKEFSIVVVNIFVGCLIYKLHHMDLWDHALLH
jgi:hypothetical protein